MYVCVGAHVYAEVHMCVCVRVHTSSPSFCNLEGLKKRWFMDKVFPPSLRYFYKDGDVSPEEAVRTKSRS